MAQQLINVRLKGIEDGCYLMQATDGTLYSIPIQAYKMYDGMIIPVDNDQNIKISLGREVEKSMELKLPSVQHSTSVPEGLVKEQNCLVGSITSETPASNRKKWLTKAIRNLLIHYKGFKALFNSTSMKADQVWNKIRNKMCEDGFDFSLEQIKTKFSKLKQTYCKVKDHNKQTGASPMDFPWMDEFDDIFEKDHDINPETASTLESTKNYKPLKEKPREQIIPSKGSKSNTEKILNCIEMMQQQRAARQEAREKERREERQEILSALRESNQIYKEMMEMVLGKM